MKRRSFIRLAGIAAVAAGAVAVALPLGERCYKIEASRSESWILYCLHNRLRPEQRVFVWKSGGKHGFTVDNGNHLETGRDWSYLGRLEWRVDAVGQRFEYWVHS